MPHSVTYDEDLSITVITYHGLMDVSSLKGGASAATRVARKHGCFHILIDARGGELDLSTMDIYELPQIFSDIISELGLQISEFKRALVVSIDSDDFSFIENTAHNRGQDAMVFRDIDQAKAWLSGK